LAAWTVSAAPRNEGFSRQLRKGGPVAKTIPEYLRGKRKNEQDCSISENLDALFDDVVHALLDEHIEHSNRVHQKRMAEEDVEGI